MGIAISHCYQMAFGADGDHPDPGVLKPPEQSPLALLRIVELLQQVLPPGVVEVVRGTGSQAGAALAGQPLLGKLSSRGRRSSQRVLKSTAEKLTPARAGAGRQEAIIVFDDADLDLALGGRDRGDVLHSDAVLINHYRRALLGTVGGLPRPADTGVSTPSRRSPLQERADALGAGRGAALERRRRGA